MDNITKLCWAFRNAYEILMAMLVDDQAQVAQAIYQKGGLSEDVARIVSCYFHPAFRSKTGKKYDTAWSKWEDMELELILLLKRKQALEFLQSAYDLNPADLEDKLKIKMYGLSIKRLYLKELLINNANFQTVLAQDEDFQADDFYIDLCKAGSMDWIKPIYKELILCPPFSRTVIKGNGLDYLVAVDLLCSKYQISTDLCRKILNPDSREKMFQKMGNDLIFRLRQVDKQLANHPTLPLI